MILIQIERSGVFVANFYRDIFAFERIYVDADSSGVPVAVIRILIRVFYAFIRSDFFYSRFVCASDILRDVRGVFFGNIERTFVENSEIRNVRALAGFAGCVHSDIIHPVSVSRSGEIDNEFVPDVFDGCFDVFSAKSEMVNVLIERPVVSVVGVDVVYREEQTSRVVISYFKRNGLIIVSFGLKVKSAGVPVCGVVRIKISLFNAVDRFRLLNEACRRG